MSVDRTMETTRTILLLNPKLVTAEGIQELVMKGKIDFNTGAELQDLKEEEASLSSANTLENEDQVAEIAKSKLFTGDEVSSFEYPTAATAVVIKTALHLASDEEQKTFSDMLDQLNDAFQNIYRKRRADITRSVKDVLSVSQDGIDEQVSEDIMEAIKGEVQLFIRK